jgi:hypothetical protein
MTLKFPSNDVYVPEAHFIHGECSKLGLLNEMLSWVSKILFTLANKATVYL